MNQNLENITLNLGENAGEAIIRIPGERQELVICGLLSVTGATPCSGKEINREAFSHRAVENVENTDSTTDD